MTASPTARFGLPALLAWPICREAVLPIQALGAVVALAGVVLARGDARP